MNWDAIGAIGDMVGAAAVVITLAFLTIQIRQSQKAQQEGNAIARAAAWDKVYEHYKGHRRLIASDPEVARIWLEGRSGGALDPVEQERFEELAQDLIYLHSIWHQRGMHIGHPEMADHAVRQMLHHLHENPGLRQFWNVVNFETSSPVFGTRVNADLAREAGEPPVA
jgi:hypothetical protein